MSRTKYRKSQKKSQARKKSTTKDINALSSAVRSIAGNHIIGRLADKVVENRAPEI